jgi:hypothetical protein
MSKSHTMKNKVVFITHTRNAHVTRPLKTGNPLRAAHINGEIMNANTKTEKCSNFANRKSEVMQMSTLSLG